MTDTPKPPEGYETWLDYACATMDTRSAYLESCRWEDRPPVPCEEMRNAVGAELSELRAYKTAYMEAMARIKMLINGWADVAWDDARQSMRAFLRDEIASWRFKP